MIRRTKSRLAHATTVALVAGLSLTSTAAATPRVQVDNTLSPTRALFTDDATLGPAVLDNLQVKAVTTPGNVVFTFTELNGQAITLLPGSGCTPGGTPNIVICTIPNPGATGADVMLGEGGNQLVSFIGPGWLGLTTTSVGGAGDDTFAGGQGSDTFTGNTGKDDFTGTDDPASDPGVDTVSYAYAAAGQPVQAAIDDRADSGIACPDLACERDTIRSSIENLVGGAGNDTLTGSAGPNTLDGAGGNDRLFGLAGTDILIGGAGDDTFFGGGPEADQMAGGAGVNTVDYSADPRPNGHGVDVNLQDQFQREYNTPPAGPTEDTLSGISNVTGTSLDDRLTGDTGANVMRGGGGNDEFFGEKTAGAVGGDTVFGDAGNDTFHYDDGAHDAGVTTSLDDQPNDGLPAAGVTPAEGDNIHSDVENLVGGAGNDTFAGSTAQNVLDGLGGIDTASFLGRPDGVVATLTGGGPEADSFLHMENLTGGSGDDTLIGDAGDSVLNGGPGNDTLRGGLGKDTLIGETGSDTIDYSQDPRFQPINVNLNAGTAQQVGDAPGSEDTLATVENVIGTSRDDLIQGDNGPNYLIGLAGADTLTGLAGDDVLDPGTGAGGGSDGSADIIEGGNGTDTVTYAARTQPVSVKPEGTANDGAAGEGDNVAPTVENAIGGSGDDVITADDVPSDLLIDNFFDGGPGNDTITGLGGNDLLVGGTGVDSIDGGDGNDTIRLVDLTADNATACGNGSDTVEADDIDPVNADCEVVTRSVSGLAQGPAASIVAIDNPSRNEGDSGSKPLVFTVTLSAPQSGAVTVPFGTVDGTAKVGEDYTAAAGTLVFAAGETTKTISVPVKGDTKVEPDEQFGVLLGTPTGNAALGAVRQGVGTILDDDKAGGGGSGASKKLPKKVTATIGRKRDRSLPYRFVVRGRIARPRGVSKKRGCRGKVQVQIKRGSKRIRTRRGKVNKKCHYRVVMVLKSRRGIPRSGRLRIVVRFQGNRAMKARNAKSVNVRAG